MREKILYALSALAAILLARNLYVMFLVLPDEAAQGAIWRIFLFHLPASIASFLGLTMAVIASVTYLVTKDFKYDAFAASAIEVSMAFITITLVTGSIWARIIWGIWWTWDHRLTSTLILWLLYLSYVMLRPAISDPAQRARFSAVLSIFAGVDAIIVWKSIEWWRTQHPGPVLSIRTGGGNIDPAWESLAYWNLLALVLLAAVLVTVRMRQEFLRREIDGLRQMAHAM